MGQMDRSGTEDLGITARLMYGYILSNTSVLTAAESSLVLIAGLIPQDVNPQLKVCHLLWFVSRYVAILALITFSQGHLKVGILCECMMHG